MDKEGMQVALFFTFLFGGGFGFFLTSLFF